MAMSTLCSITIVGGGPGGYPAAFRAADLGLTVTLVDSTPALGGTCLHRGCIPSKALLHAARLTAEARNAAEIGIEFAPPVIRLEALRLWKESVTNRLSKGLAQLAKARGVSVVQAHATLCAADQLRIHEEGGPTSVHSFEKLLWATGSEPVMPSDFPSGHPSVWDSTVALTLPAIPDRLVVVGGGYIGLELGTVYAGLGSRVTIVEMTGSLLPGVDRDLVSPLVRRLKSTCHAVHLNTRVAGMQKEAGGLGVMLENTRTGETHTEAFDKVLVAVGRQPVTRGLGLETAGVSVDVRGFIQTDSRGQTSNPHIFAAGDVAGNPMLAHKATHEAQAVMAALLGPSRGRALHVPAVVFTDPEIAWVGRTETQAKEEGLPVRVSKFPWAASGRALTLNRTDGLTKIVADPGTGRLLGVGIAGPGAGDLISEAVLALESGATAVDLAHVIHPHPTLSETLGEAAELHEGLCTHLYRPPATP